MNDLIKNEDRALTTWHSERLGLFAGVLEGAKIAEIVVDNEHRTAPALREIALILTEVADTLDHSPAMNDVLAAIRYLETFQTDITMTANGQQLTIPAGSSISNTLIALAEAVKYVKKEDGGQ